MKKALYLFLLFSILYSNSQSQSLITTFPQLNAGGYINAIVDDSTNNKFYIAGNFTTVNGTARRNIARLSYNVLSNSYILDNWIPVTAMVGEIYCMAKYNNELYIGGNFTSSNGNGNFNHWSKILVSTAAFDGSFNPDATGAINNITDFEFFAIKKGPSFGRAFLNY